ncbi:hypothetical protein KGF57_003107 [Candida theae]|uniref:Uncharacterized protein n=1 Tax=Candida theae TaxID=1198502 RepID=A0AAD5BE22_9ASCO|nr:uncharacterized protein KGF57_003107 [Candida theae]KAI5957840.1 hypothetical protein KGF57_003107 [Candida theae]
MAGLSQEFVGIYVNTVIENTMSSSEARSMRKPWNKLESESDSESDSESESYFCKGRGKLDNTRKSQIGKNCKQTSPKIRGQHSSIQGRNYIDNIKSLLCRKVQKVKEGTEREKIALITITPIVETTSYSETVSPKN